MVQIGLNPILYDPLTARLVTKELYCEAYVALKYNDFLHLQKILPDLIRISYMSWKYATFIIEATRQKGIKA